MENQFRNDVNEEWRSAVCSEKHSFIKFCRIEAVRLSVIFTSGNTSSFADTSVPSAAGSRLQPHYCNEKLFINTPELLWWKKDGREFSRGVKSGLQSEWERSAFSQTLRNLQYQADHWRVLGFLVRFWDKGKCWNWSWIVYFGCYVYVYTDIKRNSSVKCCFQLKYDLSKSRPVLKGCNSLELICGLCYY